MQPQAPLNIFVLYAKRVVEDFLRWVLVATDWGLSSRVIAGRCYGVPRVTASATRCIAERVLLVG